MEISNPLFNDRRKNVSFCCCSVENPWPCLFVYALWIRSEEGIVTSPDLFLGKKCESYFDKDFNYFIYIIHHQRSVLIFGYKWWFCNSRRKRNWGWWGIGQGFHITLWTRFWTGWWISLIISGSVPFASPGVRPHLTIEITVGRRIRCVPNIWMMTINFLCSWCRIGPGRTTEQNSTPSPKIRYSTISSRWCLYYTKRFIGSSFGWLIAVDTNFAVTLFNPFSASTIRLPPVITSNATSLDDGDYDISYFNHEY